MRKLGFLALLAAICALGAAHAKQEVRMSIGPATPGIKMRLIHHADAVDAMNKKYGPLYNKGALPDNTCPGQEKSAETVDVWAVLLTDERIPDKIAYEVVKTLFEKKAELTVVAKDASYMTYEDQFSGAISILFHPGALKYSTEKGWKPRW